MRLARLLLRLRAADARDAVAAARAPAAAASGSAAAGWPAPRLGVRALSAAAAVAPTDAAASRVQPRPGQQQGARGDGHAPPDDGASELKEALSGQGLSHSAVMAIVGWAPAASQAARDNMVARAAALQEAFGRQHANRMLVVEPSLLNLTERRIRHNFEGIQEALKLTAQQATSLVRNHPTVLRASMALLRERHAMLRQLLQLEDAALQAFLLRAPSVLRLADGKLAAQMEWLQEAAGVGRAHVVRAYRSWPQLATTSIAVLQDRHAALAQLLAASPAEMRRIISIYPNLLARDPGALRSNTASLTALLGAAEEEVQALLRKEPGLLSYNMSTLATRWSYAMQVLRLPREQGLSLLSINRPLLSITTQLPDRVEGLRRLLDTTDDELYPLLHKHVAVLRYPTDHAAAKLGAFRALTALHPAWAAACEGQPKHQLVRVVMGSWGCLYRLVFLLATGQAGTAAALAALRVQSTVFSRTYPDYAEWLDRYNQEVGPDRAIPACGSLKPVGRDLGPDAPALLTQSSARWKLLGSGGPGGWDGGPFDTRRQGEEQPLAGWGTGGGGAGAGGHGGIIGGGQHHVAGGGGSPASGAGCNSGAGAGDAGPPEAVEASQEAILAHWLGLAPARVEQLLAEHPQLARLSWAAWRARVDAAEALVALMRGGGGEDWGGAAVEGPGEVAGLQLQGSGRRAGGARAEALAAVAAAAGLRPAGDAAARARPAGGMRSPVGVAAQDPRDSTLTLDKGAAALAPCPAVVARTRALMADGGLHPVAAAALATAANLAPFSPRLWRPPPRASAPAAGAMLSACPKAWAGASFVARCRWLTALAAASPAVLAELRRAPLGELARAPLAPRAAYEVLQYLVAERRPQPWPFSVRDQIARPRSWVPGAAFLAAHPGFVGWREGMRNGVVGGGGGDGAGPGSGLGGLSGQQEPRTLAAFLY